MFLTPEQLEDLTGLKQGAAQIRWLRKNRIDHTVRADGRPRVLAATLVRTTERPQKQPRFDAVGARH